MTAVADTPRPGGGEQSSLRGEPFVFPVRVYYEDTDAAGVVYYANYLKFMERARTEWLAAIGMPLAELEAAHGIVFVVTHADITFRGPARLGDRLDVSVEPQEIGASRIELHQVVRCGKEDLVTAQVEIACVNTATFRPVRIPEPVIAKIGKKT